MFSFLKEIDKYLKENKIPLKKLKFSYTFLPVFINQAILNEMRKVTEHFEFGVPTYELIYDKNNNLCLLVKDINGKNLTIFTNNEKNVSFNFKYITRSEEKLIKSACILEYIDDYRPIIRKTIERDYPDAPKLDKIRAEYKAICDLMKRKRYKNAINKIDYKTPLMDSVEKITNYIDTLYENNKKRVETSKNEIPKGISYKEPEKDLINRNAPISKCGHSRERINDIIATDIRFSVLEKFPYICRDYAYNYFNKEISYMAYMYNIGDDKYILILEPYNGQKYTKIVIIKDSETITKEKFNAYVKYYLELSNNKTINDDRIIRIAHTSLEQYERKIKYAIAYLDHEICSNYYKDKIKKLRER